MARALVREMVGTWDVAQWMWAGEGAEVVKLPRAVARRQMIGDDFVQEVMSEADGAAENFTRVAYFGYNEVGRQYEYFSLDTRAPQMMNERSFGADGEAPGAGGIDLHGGVFVAPAWGEARDAAFRYRLAVGRVEGGRQIVELWLTPLSAERRGQFLAFRYLYTRRA
jgi:Protein of unknown function (DUF1579)